MDKTIKTINKVAKNESKHRAKGRNLWAKSYDSNISEKHAKKLRSKAKFEYDMADSIHTAQGHLPSTTIYDNRKYNIASGNKIGADNKAKLKLSPKFNYKQNKK